VCVSTAVVTTEKVVEMVKSSFFGFGKKAIQQIMQTVEEVEEEEVEVFDDDADRDYCVADSECLGRIAQDMNQLNAFFSTRVGQEKAQDYLAILNEVLLMLQLPIERLGPHALSRISEYPSSAEVRILFT
jgi:histidinol dehydrogenase